MKPATGLRQRIDSATGFARRYIILLFIVFLGAIYAFLAFRAFSLEQTTPDATSVSTQLQTAGVPHIDSSAVTKIQQLQDNSVSVQTLFDQARQSPFEEN